MKPNEAAGPQEARVNKSIVKKSTKMSLVSIVDAKRFTHVDFKVMGNIESQSRKNADLIEDRLSRIE